MAQTARSKLAEKRNALIVARYQAGDATREIARQFGVMPSYVSKVARHAGLPPKREPVAAGSSVPPLPEHKMLAVLRADPDWIEIAPRHFVTRFVFFKYRRLTGWRDIRPAS